MTGLARAGIVLGSMGDDPLRFSRRESGRLFAEDLALSVLAARHGTPLFVYSANSFRDRYRRLRDDLASALAPLTPLVAFSVKACPSLGILSLLASEGSSFDVVSAGELWRVARAGGDPRRVIFAGVGKTDPELDFALEADVFQINVESAGELSRLDALARQRSVRARVALRVNPELDPQTHRHLATGSRASKFGIPIGQVASILETIRRFPSVDVVGLHVHLGSMLRDPNLYGSALALLVELAGRVPGWRPRTLDLGGGFAVRVGGEAELEPGRVAAALAPNLLALGCTPIFEPGRWIAAPSGLLLARVLDRKRSGGKTLVVVDAGMNDLLRPALYDAVHPIESVERADQANELVDVVGPVCESGDFLGRDVRLPALRVGDLVAVRDAGAYGFSMASNYNSRPRPAEVLVDGEVARVIRRRESFDDLVRGESA